MLVIRMQRTGRSGHAQFRVIAQDKRFSPTSGRVVAYLGDYNPHTKNSNLDKEKIEQLLSKGAQPSGRTIKLLKKEGIKLPEWVKTEPKREGKVRNPDKRRSTRPKEAVAPKAAAPAEPAADGVPEEPMAEEAVVSSSDDQVPDEGPTNQQPAEPAEETALPASPPKDDQPFDSPTEEPAPEAEAKDGASEPAAADSAPESK